ncbi:MAG: hypothetical protein ABW298_02715 [Candidatus Binatia bacterium]
MDWISIASAAIAGVAGALIATATVGRWRDRPVAFIAVMVASFTVLNVLSEMFLLPRIHRMRGAVQVERSASREWTLTRIDDSALSLSLPGPLTPRPIALPGDAQASMSRFSVSTWEGDGINIAVSHVVSKPGVPTSLNGAIEGALKNLRKMSGASVEETRRPWQLDGRAGVIVDLRILAPNDETVGHSLFLTEGPELWQVLILHKPEQTAGERVTARLIESARFDRPASAQ